MNTQLAELILCERTLSPIERTVALWFMIKREVRLDQVGISEQLNIPLRTLERTLSRLVRMNILKSRAESYGCRAYQVQDDTNQWRLFSAG
jgi:hypothetical protein